MKKEEEIIRVRIPEGSEVLGVVEELLGASRFKVRCDDGNTRLCRIPGKFRKRVKIKAGDVVLIKPWNVEPETKGDIEWIYTKTQTEWLKRKGLLKDY